MIKRGLDLKPSDIIVLDFNLSKKRRTIVISSRVDFNAVLSHNRDVFFIYLNDMQLEIFKVINEKIILEPFQTNEDY